MIFLLTKKVDDFSTPVKASIYHFGRANTISGDSFIFIGDADGRENLQTIVHFHFCVDLFQVVENWSTIFWWSFWSLPSPTQTQPPEE